MDHAELAQEVWVEAPSDLKRRLAAIAFADVAGYSRLMDANEAETIRRWKALQAEIVEPLMARHGGHLVDRAGNSLMVEFASVVNAVRWAIEVQRSHWSGGNYWDTSRCDFAWASMSRMSSMIEGFFGAMASTSLPASIRWRSPGKSS